MAEPKRTTEYTVQEIVNLISRDYDEDGIPDSIAIANPDGTPIGG